MVLFESLDGLHGIFEETLVAYLGGIDERAWVQANGGERCVDGARVPKVGLALARTVPEGHWALVRETNRDIWWLEKRHDHWMKGR